MDSHRATVVAFHENAPPHTNVPATVTTQIPQTLPAKEVVGLCQAMRESVPFSANRNSIICFTGSGRDDIVATVALEAASTAASQVNLRVLLIDAIANPEEASRKPLLAALRTTLQSAIAMDLPVSDAMTAIRGTHLSYSCLSQPGQGETAVSILGPLKKLLEDMRSTYDLIIINAGSVMERALSLELIKLSDGAVLVIEAERTRAPVAMRAKNIIESSGARVIGAVLGNRRYHIPEKLYKRL